MTESLPIESAPTKRQSIDTTPLSDTVLSDPNHALLESTARVPEHVVYRPFVNETVILNLETGQYHGVNPTGGRMLEALEKASSVRDAAAQLADEYGRPVHEIESDLCEFCSDLGERGLIVIRASGSAT